jgi:hypothetical protein
MGIPQVEKTETQKFGKQWLYNGLAVTLDDTTIQFATEWANLLLSGFARQVALAFQQAQAQAEAQTPVVKEEPKSNGLIIEG